MNYPALLDRLAKRGLFRIKPGLDRVRVVLKHVGDPHLSFKAVHIAGTNGKGSVAAGLESVLRHAGYKTGLYTSPHLWDIRERIQLDRQPVPVAIFWRAAQRVFEAESSADVQLTYFEFVTVMAFLIFAEQAVDLAVIETGLGGRWDATNVLVSPEACVITSIGLDHTAWLGKTERAIAGEKAGIIKPGVPVVSGVRGPGEPVIRAAAARLRAVLHQAGHDFRADEQNVNWQQSFQRFQFSSRLRGSSAWQVSLLGDHQIDNAALVVATADVLIDRGWKIDEPALQAGLAQIEWPGRFHLWPSAEAPRVLFDGAHNPSAMQRFLETLDRSPWRDAPKTFLFGAYRDKDYRRMLKMIQPRAHRAVICSLPGPRALPVKTTAAGFKRRKDLFLMADPHKALQHAFEISAATDLIVVTGSLALVGSLLQDVLVQMKEDTAITPQTVSIPQSIPLTHV